MDAKEKISPKESLFRFALSLGVMMGSLEIALVAKPQMGFSIPEIATMLLSAIGSYAIFALISALTLFRAGASHGLTMGVLLSLHACVFYRYEVATEFQYESWTLWGGMGLIFIAVLIVSAIFDRLLRFRVDLLFWLISGLCCFFALKQVSKLKGTDRKDRHNTLLITMDTTRLDAIRAFGGNNLTPNIDSLARSGTIFTQAYAPSPLSKPSHLSILSGLHPLKTGVTDDLETIAPTQEMLPIAFQSAGYTTAAFVSSDTMHSRFGWSRGFDIYDDGLGKTPGLDRINLFRFIEQFSLRSLFLRERSSEITAQRAMAWMDYNYRKAFFMWVHFFDPHGPYTSPLTSTPPPIGENPPSLPEYWPKSHRQIEDLNWLTEAYYDEVRYVDLMIGHLMDKLKELGLFEKTLIVLTSSNGESLDEHQYYFRHGDQLFDSSLHVPLIFHAPDYAVPQRVSCQLDTTHIAATILDLMNINDGLKQRSPSLSPQLRGMTCKNQPVLSMTGGEKPSSSAGVSRSLRIGQTKLIRDHVQEPSSEYCYDVLNDPTEISPRMCSRVLKAALSLTVERKGGSKAPNFNAEMRRTLREMGLE